MVIIESAGTSARALSAINMSERLAARVARAMLAIGELSVDALSAVPTILWLDEPTPSSDARLLEQRVASRSEEARRCRHDPQRDCVRRAADHVDVVNINAAYSSSARAVEAPVP